MSDVDEEDLKLQRASAAILSDLDALLPKILWKHKHGTTTGEVHQRVRVTDMYRVFTLLEPFQEDPQVLDTHLKTFLPPLVAAYLDLFRHAAPKPKKHFVPLSHAICQIINLFCKIRGEKVIKGFLNNEPRYLEPVLLEFEKGENIQTNGDEPPAQGIVPWTERHVLLLWLSHLMLAPFPLASMSTLQSSEETSVGLGIDLPPEVPGITLRVLTICIEGLQSATKERGAAANLLVRLSVRPDMQTLGLLDTLVRWSLSFFSNASESQSDIHQCLGVLTFLAGLVSSATNEEIGPFIPSIYQSCHNIISQENLAFVKASAVARKLVVKSLRNIVLHCLQATSTPNQLDPTTAIEEVIEFLLEALEDGDSPVRYAASKALSIITMKLDPEMGVEVVEAILGSLGENVYWQGSKRNLSGVNPLRWHGLTLTLSHLLYRRALSTAQLPDVLNALLLALAFEQRSATGGSIGTNVRDAACFGIWALSRRYLTKYLLAVETSSVRASQHLKSLTVLQVLAIELLSVACLDPAGNIRRGSSAALQELVGRHPNTVAEGISLVQVVDFHAVGLRDRAMCDVAIKASQLHQMYWESLFEGLLDWRGTGSLDAPSRLSAASAIGLLSEKQPTEVIHRMASNISEKLQALRPREVEERQGIVMSLSALVKRAISTNVGPMEDPTSLGPQVDLTYLWALFKEVLALDDKSFTSPTLRPEFTASTICNFLGVMATMSVQGSERFGVSEVPTDQIVRLFNLCLGRHEISVLEAIPLTSRSVTELLSRTSPDAKHNMISGWLERLENEASYNGLRCSGFAIALGAAYSLLVDTESGPQATQEQFRIVKVLTFRCTTAVAIEARTVALQALDVLLKNCPFSDASQSALPENIRDQIASALHIALNDYTVTERGDIGSLVRVDALSAIGTAWRTGLIRGCNLEDQLNADVLRLSLEKLDKVRVRAAEVLERDENSGAAKLISDGASSYTYFSNALQRCQQPSAFSVREAILLGFVSSAGMGSESVVQNARAALMDTIDLIPTTSDNEDAFSLLHFADCLVGLMKANLDTDRVLIPLLDVLAFLFDMQVFHRMIPTTFSFRNLLSLTQKSHFKSTNMQKLHLALDVYRGLATIPSTRTDTITKVASMLLHPFPKVRIAAAETLWILTQEDDLKRQDWSLPTKSLKPAFEGIKESLGSSVKV
ncbi:hypothetical protein P154DRAFT_475433 [Amniculicola lignicola CBS 123094]|uniref:Uncharacterized protein n=1 Tax=Amniculicola lignicola CBS 123094 TaxID=1392246 RepID=A0A6A5W0V3_9PLEO|nr:hypothetical protein P154DRAFT_475433 [Amniculicola lignicola CBS 123094]